MATLLLPLALLLLAQAVSTEAIFLRGTQELSAGNYSAAEASFRQVLARQPGNLGALGNLGVVYSRLNLPSKAIEAYRRALVLAPDEPGLLLNLGLAYLKLDDCGNAKPLFARLLNAASSRQAQARELHAICELQGGDIASATATLEGLVQQPPASAGVYHFLALAYVKQGRETQAREVLARLFSQLPEDKARYLEGRVWYDATRFEDALDSFTKALAANPDLEGASRELGKTQISLRKDEEAERSLRRALDLAANDTEASYFLGALLIRRGQHAQALPLLREVKSARPDLWGTSYYLGKGELASGKPAIALPLLEEAALRAPNEAAVQYQLAQALRQLGRKAEAARAFARVSALNAAGNAESIVMK